MIIYAKAGETPPNWRDIRVFDTDNNEIKDVSEIDIIEGWAIVAERDANGKLFVRNNNVATVKITGKFHISVDRG
jgi:hypothetical protein